MPVRILFILLEAGLRDDGHDVGVLVVDFLGVVSLTVALDVFVAPQLNLS